MRLFVSAPLIDGIRVGAVSRPIRFDPRSRFQRRLALCGAAVLAAVSALVAISAAALILVMVKAWFLTG